MKRLFKSVAFAVAGSLAIVSCQKAELQEDPIAEDAIFFTLTTADRLAEAEVQSKTYMEYDEKSKNYNPFWYKGDKIGVFFNTIITAAGSDRSGFDLSLTNSNDSGSEAIFVGSTGKTLPDSGKIYAFYPNDIAKAYAKDSLVAFNILATQHPTATSFDPKADLLIAQPVKYNLSDSTASGKTVTIDSVRFARALAILRLNLYTTDFAAARGASVTRLTVTSEGNTLGGQPRFDITKENSAKIIDYKTTSPSVSAEYTGAAVGAATIGTAKGEGGYVFLVVAPAGSLAGEKLVVEGEIEAKGAGDEITVYTFQKTIESLPSSVVLNPGHVLPVAVGLAEINFEEKKPETRLYVEGFDKCSTDKKPYQPSETGVFGLGVEEGVLSYYYSNGNCNIRNTSGKSPGDPYLYINKVDDVGQHFIIQKLNVPEAMPLTFSAWVKYNGTLTVKVKPSESEDNAWEEFGSIVHTKGTTGEVYSIASADTYTIGNYDFKLELYQGTSGYLYVDDIVIDKDNRITLDTPVVTASLDEEMSNKINVTWDAVENAGSYEVTLQKKAGDPGFNVRNTEDISINFVGLDYDTEYSVSVKALPADESLYRASAYSEWKNVTTGAKGIEWKAKTFAELAEGDEVVVVGIKDGVGSRALADDSVGATDPAAVAITFTNDILDSAPADNIIWTVGVNGDNRIFYKDANKNKWLYCINKPNVRVGTTTSDQEKFVWEKTDETDETSGYMKNVGKNVYIGVNFNTSVWYTADDLSSTKIINGQTFKFFVKDDPRTALATPVITVTPNSIDKKIIVSWAQVTDAASYKVTCTGQEAKTIEEKSCNFTDLTPGEYTVTVTAVAQPGSTQYRDSQAASETFTIEDATPVISYTTPETAAADQTSVEFAYEITRPRKDVELEVTKVDETVDWITGLSVDSENKKVSVTLTKNTTSVARKAQLKLSYGGAAEDKTLYINQNGVVTEEYASLAALVDAGEPTPEGKTVKVTLTNDEIVEKASSYIVLMSGNQPVKLYKSGVPSNWMVEGKVSGTLTCPWLLYNNVDWELKPSDWSELNYTAPLEPCATPVITISDQGSATIECATDDATIYYAVSDTEPTEFTQAYTVAVSLTDGQTIWAQAKKDGYNKPSAVVYRTYTSGGGAGYTGPLATWGNTAFTVTDNITNSKISSDLCGTNATLGAKSSDGTLQTLTKTSHNSGAVYVVCYEASADSYWEITLPITEKIVSGTKINLSYNAAVNSGGITSWTAYCNENAMGDPVTIAVNGTPKALSDLTAVACSYTLTSDVASGSSITIKIQAASSGSKKNTRITNISVSAD